MGRALARRATPAARPVPTISHYEFLRAHDHPTVRDALRRYDRGDFAYIDALERIAVALLSEIDGG